MAIFTRVLSAVHSVLLFSHFLLHSCYICCCFDSLCVTVTTYLTCGHKYLIFIHANTPTEHETIQTHGAPVLQVKVQQRSVQ